MRRCSKIRWTKVSWFGAGLALLVLWTSPVARGAQDDKATGGAEAPVPAAEETEKAAPSEPAVPAAKSQGAAPDTAAQPQQSMLVWVYKAEGVFFVPQMGISVLVIFMIIFYSMQIRTASFMPAPFMQQFDALFKEKKFQEAYELVKKEESFLGKMVTAGIGRLSLGFQQAVEASQEVADDENMKHEHRLSYLAMIANLATMVGLLGTVWGMVASFMVISRSDTAPKPSELATGVSQALVTTVFGLVQAIPATLAFTILKNRAARLGYETGMAAEQIMTRFANMAKRPAAATTPGTTQG